PKLCGAREIAELNHYPEEGQRLIFLAENPVHVGDLVDAARAALPFVAFAYSKGVAGAEEAGRAIEAALSAQPSPGGQGGLNYERMFVDACAALAEVSRELGCDPEQGGAEPILAAIAELRESVAARQPVGEPVAEAIEQLADDVESCVSDACGYLASDSGWDDYGIYRDDAAARYRALPDRIRALAAAPAQVVDLGALVAELAEADREYSEAKKKYYTVSAKSSAAGGRAACSAAYQREVTAKARLDAAVRALIDSQAVGK
ncbi:TPA: hypothetical protein ACOEOJ_003111, partial [Stenotrophomonas maltophilia]